MTARLVEREGGILEGAGRGDLEERLDQGRFFWLDLYRPTPDDFASLRDVFRFHPLALEDSQSFDQRAKVEQYDGFVFLVVFGWSPDDDGLVEVHCFVSDSYLVTVRQDASPAVDELHHRYGEGLVLGEPIRALHRIVDTLVDSFFPALADFDDRLDELEGRLLVAPNPAELQELMRMRRHLATLRRAVGPERDMLGRIAGGMTELPGLDQEAERFFRDVYDHLLRLGETIDAYRDLTSGAMDVYLSSSSNRLNEVMKQLTIIATIFLPLTFMTGYFGQNFGWLVQHVGGLASFVVLGAVAQLLVVIGLLGWFRRRRWL